MLDGILTSNAEGTRYVYAIVNKHPSDAQTLRLASNGLKKKSGKIKGHRTERSFYGRLQRHRS